MSLKDALNDAMKENGSWMEKMKKDHEIQLRTQKHNVDMYRRHNDKLEKQNDKLEKQIERLTKAFKQSKEENEKLKGEKMVLHNRVCIEESANLLLRNENKKLKEEQFDNMEELAKRDGMCLVDIHLYDKLIEKSESKEEVDYTEFGFCHKCNRSLTEDDFGMGKGMCESCCCEEEEVKEEEKKDVCKSCKREKLSEHEFWFPVGNGEYLCCGCGMSYM